MGGYLGPIVPFWEIGVYLHPVSHVTLFKYMIKIIYIKDYKKKRTGSVDYVSTNVAFGLVDSGIAIRGDSPMVNLYEAREDKMMRPVTKGKKRAKRQYKIK